VNSARDDYESLLKKLKQIENDTATGKKGTWRTKGVNPVKVQQDFQESRRVFEEKNINFQTHLRELHTVTRFDLIQRLAAFFYGTRSSFQQGFDTLDDVGEDLLDVMRDLDEAKREYLADKDKEKNRISIFINQTTSSGLQKQGYLYKHSTGKVNVKSESMRWFVLKDGALSWYNNWKSIEPSGSVRLQISRLKPIFDKPLCFEVLQADPEVRINMRALTQKDFKEWVDAINNAIAFALTHDSTPAAATPASSEAYYNMEDSFLTKIRSIDESNLICADCCTPKPDWASINLGSLVCIDCSGIHRSLGVHISKVRSLTMDQLKPEVQQFMLSMGNDQVNAIFEANLTESDTKPTPQSDRPSREAWIKAKYVDKKFVAPHKSAKTLQRHFQKHILDAEATEADFPKLIRYIAQGADVNKMVEATGKSLLHLLVELDRPGVLQVLLLNGAKVDLKDEQDEQTPLHYAAKLGLPDCASVLLSMPNAEVDCKDKSDLTPAALVANGDKSKEGVQKCFALFEAFTRRDSSETSTSPAAQSPSVQAISQSRGRSGSNTPKMKDAKGGSSSLFGFLRSKNLSEAEDIAVSAPTTVRLLFLCFLAPLFRAQLFLDYSSLPNLL
jgi:Arf-GAP with coiled-coil, ANK repeat and PH domain-containing protein